MRWRRPPAMVPVLTAAGGGGEVAAGAGMTAGGSLLRRPRLYGATTFTGGFIAGVRQWQIEVGGALSCCLPSAVDRYHVIKWMGRQILSQYHCPTESQKLTTGFNTETAAREA